MALDRFIEVSRWMLPIYSALHFVPSILFRWNVFRADPARVLMRASVGSMRSSAFLGAFVVICQGELGSSVSGGLERLTDVRRAR